MNQTLSQDKRQQLTELLASLLDEKPTAKVKYPDHRAAIQPWQHAMAKGTLTGKAFSSHTVKNYSRYVLWFMDKYDEVSYENLEQELNNTPVDMFGRRDKYFKAILSFAKFLIRNHSLDENFIDQAMQIKPQRHKPPVQRVVTEVQYYELLKASKTPLLRLLIIMLASTGLRASECCQLNVGNVDLLQGVLLVERGKGGKRRKVGMNRNLIAHLKRHLAALSDTSDAAPLFVNTKGKRMQRDGLLNRIRRLGQETGIKVSPHVLRRAFVTINANKGRSLVMLQMACGHADIKTTRDYCKTTENEVIQAMKRW